MSMTRWVTGIYLRKPPISRMSCLWCIAVITLPAPRNSKALKQAWVNR